MWLISLSLMCIYMYIILLRRLALFRDSITYPLYSWYFVFSSSCCLGGSISKLVNNCIFNFVNKDDLYNILIFTFCYICRSFFQQHVWSHRHSCLPLTTETIYNYKYYFVPLITFNLQILLQSVKYKSFLRTEHMKCSVLTETGQVEVTKNVRREIICVRVADTLG